MIWLAIFWLISAAAFIECVARAPILDGHEMTLQWERKPYGSRGSYADDDVGRGRYSTMLRENGTWEARFAYGNDTESYALTGFINETEAKRICEVWHVAAQVAMRRAG